MLRWPRSARDSQKRIGIDLRRLRNHRVLPLAVSTDIGEIRPRPTGEQLPGPTERLSTGLCNPYGTGKT